TRARKTTAGRIGRDHFANLSVLGNHNPRKWRANSAIVHRLLSNPNTGFGGSHLLLGELDFGFQAVGVGCGVVERFLRLDAGLLELLGSVQRNLRILELNLVVGNGGSS